LEIDSEQIIRPSKPQVPSIIILHMPLAFELMA
jgi:hypothetical protein